VHQRCARGVAHHPDRSKLSGRVRVRRTMRRRDRVRDAESHVLEAARLAAARTERRNGYLWERGAAALARPQRNSGARGRAARRARGTVLVPPPCEAHLSANQRPVWLPPDAYGAARRERLLELPPSSPCSPCSGASASSSDSPAS
jgi:hypothetical protein